MSEPVVTPEPAATAPEAAPAAPEAAAPKPTETVEFWKQQARANEQRAKANADAATELQKIKDGELSELQLALKRADEATKRADVLERTTLQQQVALSKGIPADLVSALSGSTADELAAHADRLLAWRGTVTPAPIPQPAPDLGQGARPGTPEGDVEAQYASVSAQFNNRRR